MSTLTTKSRSFSLVLVMGAALAGCSKPVPVAYANLCDAANNKKTIEVDGYFNSVGSVMCSTSKAVPHMTCPVPFVDTPGAKQPLTANLDLGKGANEIDKEGLKIRDDKGELVGSTQKVKLTTKVNIFTPRPSDPNAAACYLYVVKKIEKL